MRKVRELTPILTQRDVFPVHGVGGMIGTLATDVFASADLGGVGYAGGVSMTHQIGVQLLGIVATIGWCAMVTARIFKFLALTIGLRVSPDHETEGLDLCDHGERAYTTT